MDVVDLRILKLLSFNSRLSAEKIGKEIGLTGNAVSSRIRRLEASGVITGYQVEITPSALGLKRGVVLVKSKALPAPSQLQRLNKLDYVHTAIGGLDGLSLVHIVYQANSDFRKRLKAVEEILDVYGASSEGIFELESTEVRRKLVHGDVKLLRLLTRIPRPNPSELNSALNTSVRTINRRIRRLIENKIVSFTVSLNLSKVSGYVPYHALVVWKESRDENLLLGFQDSRKEYVLWMRRLTNRSDLLAVCDRSLSDVKSDIEYLLNGDSIADVKLVFPCWVIRQTPLKLFGKYLDGVDIPTTTNLYQPTQRDDA